MINEIIIGVLLVAVYIIMRYLVKEKVKGHKCIGCPYSGSCNKACGDKIDVLEHEDSERNGRMLVG